MQVHQMKFNAAGGASGEANNAAAALLAEVPPEDLLMAEWHNSIMRPCHYLALDRQRRRLVLSIRCLTSCEILVCLLCSGFCQSPSVCHCLVWQTEPCAHQPLQQACSPSHKSGSQQPHLLDTYVVVRRTGRTVLVTSGNDAQGFLGDRGCALRRQRFPHGGASAGPGWQRA